MMNKTFLVEGNDGTTPLQAYCTVQTPMVITIDTIYPLRDIHIIVHNDDESQPFGNNAYTRQRVLREYRQLRHIFHGVMHFYHRYRAVWNAYEKIEEMEMDRYNKQCFDNADQRLEYFRKMHARLKNTYVHYLQRAIPEVPVTPDSDYVVPPYLIIQILDAIEAKSKKK